MSVLEANLAALRAVHPGLEEAVGRAPGDVRVAKTPSGHPTAFHRDASIHSRYDPVREASAIVSADPIDSASAVIILGFGLGYVAEEVQRRRPGVPLLVVEPDAAFLRAAMEARDLRAALGSPSTRLFLSSNPADISRELESLPMGSPKILRLRPVTDRNPAFFKAVEQLIGSFQLRRDININTLGRFGRLWVRNLARNIRLFADSPGILPFEGFFKDIPALMLAGGPSLDEITPVLGELWKRLLVVSVDTPLRPCLSAGVKPDFVVMVDPQYWATRYLDWTGEYDGILVAEPSTHPRSLRHPSRLHLFGGSLFPLGEHLESLIGGKGKLGAGGSVSTSAWDLCRHLGARPIYAAGLDLGFPGMRTHCRGAFFEEGWFSTQNRLDPPETRSFAYLRDIGLFPMPSNNGLPTPTDRRMILYKWWFENQLSQRPDSPTFSLSGRSVAVDGMSKADVEEVLTLPVIRPEIEERKRRLRGAAEASADSRRKASSVLDAALQGLVADLEELGSTAKRALGLTHELARAVSGGKSASSLITRLDALDRRILELSTRNIAGFLMQGTIQKITGGAKEGTGGNAAIESSTEMYGGIVESARFHCDILSRARAGL